MAASIRGAGAAPVPRLTTGRPGASNGARPVVNGGVCWLGPRAWHLEPAFPREAARATRPEPRCGARAAMKD